MNQQTQQVPFVDVVAEELLRQITMLSRDLAIVRAEALVLKQENDALKQQAERLENTEA